MREPVDRVRDLAEAVIDGTAVHWEREVAAADSDEARERLASLRIVARIAEVHGAADWADRSTGSAPEAAAKGKSRASGVGTWGPLVVNERIGQGTFGEVYRAWDPRLEREVALKLLRHDHPATAAAGAALGAVVVHEARLMARVRHPGVAIIYGADHIDGRTGLWMELVQGHTLEDELASNGAFSAAAIVQCGVAVADALAAVHRAGLLHRDVKMQNIMRAEDGRLVLTDFGTGFEPNGAGQIHPLAGTPLYMAPELLDGAAPTAQSDLYSLGVVLFRLAGGGYPVPGRTLAEVRSAHARGLRHALASVGNGLPARLVHAIDRALAVDPRERFPDAVAMQRALAESAQDVPRPRRLRTAGVAAVLGLAALLAVAGWDRLAPRDTRAATGVAGAPGLPSTGLREVSADADVEDYGSPSPDGALVSFVEDATGHLATYDVATRARTRLTGAAGATADGRAVSSRFSLDGREVAYVWRPRSGGADEVRAVPATGGLPRRLWRARPGTELHLHQWSSDRDELLLIETTARREGTLVLADVRTQTSRELREFQRHPPLYVSRSPDGHRVAFDVLAPGTGLRDVRVLDMRTGGETVVVDGPASDHSPVWTMDGTRLVFLSDRTGTIGVWTVPTPSGQPSGRPLELAANIGESRMMGLARTDVLFLDRQVRLRNVYVADFDPAARVFRGEPRAISARSGWNGASDWSPDGRSLVFFRRDADRYRLIVKDLASGAERALGDDGIDGIQRPRWARDGRSILYWTEYGGVNGLFRLDVASGVTTPALVDPRFTGFEPVPNSDRVIYHVNAREFRTGSLATGEHAPLHTVEAPYSIYGTAVSRDGHWLAYTARTPTGDHRLSVLNLVTGAVRRDVLVGAPGERLAVWDWSPEGDAVYLVRARDLRTASIEAYPHDGSRLFWVDVATGEAHLVGLDVHNLRAVRLSPDGRRMAMDIGNPLFTVWTLEHFLR